jgi:hypothetical protein
MRYKERNRLYDFWTQKDTADRDSIAASEKARQYMLDIVNLTINGPLAFSIKRVDNGKQPVISKYIRETTEDRVDNTVF